MPLLDDDLTFTASLASAADRFQLNTQFLGGLEQVRAQADFTLPARGH
jgi:hypothetical protein